MAKKIASIVIIIIAVYGYVSFTTSIQADGVKSAIESRQDKINEIMNY